MISIRLGWFSHSGKSAVAGETVRAPSARQYSSLPLVLGTSAAVLLSSALGWLLLTTETPDDTADNASTLNASPASAGEETSGVVPPYALPPEPANPGTPVRTVDVDSELRKARLAADADMLVAPPEQNALYFYGRVIAADPDNTPANTEFDAVLARVALLVSDHLSRGELNDAYEIGELVSVHKPDHPLVQTVNATLQVRADRLFATALGHSRSGDDNSATAAIAGIESLPGLDDVYIANVRESVSVEQRSRLIEEKDRLESEQLAIQTAEAEWTGKVRGAIKSGRLLLPADDNARDFLAERDEPKVAKDLLTDELLDALLIAGQQSTEGGEFGTAESYLTAVASLRADAAGLEDARSALDRKMIETEETKVLALSDFVRLNTTPARYPRLANRLNITGWVDVLFTVSQNGSTANIEVIQSQPNNIFDQSAVDAVEQWTFQPREYRGQLINQRASARLVFRLE